MWGVDRSFAAVLMGADLLSKPFKIVTGVDIIAQRLMGRNPVVLLGKSSLLYR
jgi:hypothetical protein